MDKTRYHTAVLIGIGAVAIAVDGAVVNKIGTAQIAYAANEARTNVIVAADLQVRPEDDPRGTDRDR